MNKIHPASIANLIKGKTSLTKKGDNKKKGKVKNT